MRHVLVGRWPGLVGLTSLLVLAVLSVLARLGGARVRDVRVGARGLQGLTFTRDDRAGEGKLSSRLGLVTDAVEALPGLDLYGYVVEELSQGGKVDCVIVDEARFLAPEQIDRSA